MRRRLLLAFLLGLTALAQAAEDSPAQQLLKEAELDRGSEVMTLMVRGVDPNVRDAKRQTPLHLALVNESEMALKALMAHPLLDVNAINAAAETPLMLAALKGRLDWAKLLVQRGALVNEAGWNALHYAASGPDNGVTAWLLQQGAEIDALSPNGTTALMMAAGYGSPTVAEALLAAGADAALRNQQGLDAADFAGRAQRSELQKKLRAARR
ncbi:ankyrin repeat domain-containing protein [Paucibacter sp. APW11]|uniref:Ankyrin repeat domain-containing protein n=1 Tax=Roseateles aquae TaxID=3077235 RepID=A0ABU3P651_9BURK|nr:ankyrin repeat domain-containing protein [Paucibacter sp. APW11]MDT8997695.1 ankyrin repeat domain-containing protein [Paucibacter sp. APW11]